MYETILAGGRLVDPSQSLDSQLDVAVDNGKVAAIGPDLSGEGGEVIDVTGKIVSPGFVDLHAHTYHATSGLIRDPDVLSGVYAGVTSFVDAGGVGPSHWHVLSDTIMPAAHTRIYALLSMFSLVDAAEAEASGEPMDWLGRILDPEGVKRVATENRDRVLGIKIHVMPRHLQEYGMRHLELAREVADELEIPILMHVGDIGPSSLPETDVDVTSAALNMLAPGDIMTHLFTPLTGGGLDDQGNVLPALRAAQERGVWMDTAIGDYQFGWDKAETVLAQGMRPDTIASDIELFAEGSQTQEILVVDGRTTGGRKASQFTMVEYAAFFFELGFSLPEIIAMASTNPAKAMRIDDRAGSLAVGREADMTILDDRRGHFLLTDVTGVPRIGTRALDPYATFVGGVRFTPRGAPHEWGFTPRPLDAGELETALA